MSKFSTLVYALFGIAILATIGAVPDAAAQSYTQDAAATCGKPTVKARVAVIDQPITLNRHGATIPGGMIYALLRDVVDEQGRSCHDPYADCRPGHVSLRSDKRPRPLILRVNEGEVLEIEFTNLLAPDPGCYSLTGEQMPCQGYCGDNPDQCCTCSDGSGTCSGCSNSADGCSTCGPILEQPSTRAASLHVQGLNWATSSCDDGSYVGANPDSIANPGETLTYRLFAEHQGPFFLYDNGDGWTPLPQSFPFASGGGGGNGGSITEGLFGAVIVQPPQSLYYRSQVTEQDLCLASVGHTQQNAPGRVCEWGSGDLTIDYQAIYPEGYLDPQSEVGLSKLPILSMLCTEDLVRSGADCEAGELLSSDLTAVIAGPLVNGQPGPLHHRMIAGTDIPEDPDLRQSYANPNRLQPFREFAIIYHESFQVMQAFPFYYENIGTLVSASDAFGINYSMEGLSTPIAANRLGVGPLKQCVDCKYEEFFLSSWTSGDPGMPVDYPVTDCINANTGEPQPCKPSTRALYPDDPSNVYHAYMSDHTKFRVMHAGPDLHHLHHQHAHQWLASPNTPNGDYLDSQSIGPGSAFTLEMVYGGSGNVNQTVGDSIFHCHFYPHFASGMWGLWRVHDVLETGTELTHCDDAKSEWGCVAKDARAYPDAEITTGTPIPALVPLPTLAMAPMPAEVHVTSGGKLFEVCNDKDECVSNLAQESTKTPKDLKNPGYPFIISGVAGSRAPHPPADFAWAYSRCDDNKYNGSVCAPQKFGIPNPAHLPDEPPGCICDDKLDGGLPRNVFMGTSLAEHLGFETKTESLLGNALNFLPIDGGDHDIFWSFANTDYSKEIEQAVAQVIPEDGTVVEKLGMRANAQRFHGKRTPTGGEAETPFILNGLPPRPGAPFADPCINFSNKGGPAVGVPRPINDAPGEFDVFTPDITDRYLGADIQMDAIFNKEGWHFPQQRIITLWGDVFDTLDGKRPPEPLFFRVNSYDCMEYVMANLVPNVYELDDFQVRTPTDVLGQHIHLVKFDVTSSDGSANGWNYEDGTFAPNEVTERIDALNKLQPRPWTAPDKKKRKPAKPAPQFTGILGYNDAGEPFQKGTVTFAAKPLKFFGPGPVKGDTSWVGAQATVQRWYDDPLLNNFGVCTTTGGMLPTDGSTVRCTLAELGRCSNSGGFCDASAGICSNATDDSCRKGDLQHCPNVCTAADTSRCGDPLATCIPAHDRTIRTVFTHDHFSPSTHQQAGLYAGLVVEPKGSKWLNNQTGEIMGGWDAQTNTNFVGRSAKGHNGTLVQDGGPTSWEAIIVGPEIQADWQPSSQNGGPATYREFMLEFQDSTLMYEPFNDRVLDAEIKVCTTDPERVCGEHADCPAKGAKEGRCRTAAFCSNDLGKFCMTDKECGPGGDCQTAGVCSNTGVCSNRPLAPPCLFAPPMASADVQKQLDEIYCGQDGGTCRLVIDAGLRSCTKDNLSNCASQEVFTAEIKGADGKKEEVYVRPFEGFESCNFVPGVPYTAWGAGFPIDLDTITGSVEVITFNNATNSFSVNYRNEPMAGRYSTDEKATKKDPRLDNMSYIYASIDRPGLPDDPNSFNSDLCPVYNESFAPCRYCSDNGKCCVSEDENCCSAKNAYCAPYPPLTPGVGPNDPFTPLMRVYPGDDVQIRTLVGAHINPHNFTLHGLSWLMEPSFVDSGWRASQVAGISEHFEMLLKIPSVADSVPSGGSKGGEDSGSNGVADYLYKPGAAAIEQSSGSWGILRSYDEARSSLHPLPNNEPGANGGFKTASVCPSGAPEKDHHIVALTAFQALAGQTLVYNYRQHLNDPTAILYFHKSNLDCHDANDMSTCTLKSNVAVEPLVLRVRAGDCIKVTLHNGIPKDACPGDFNNKVPGFCNGVAFSPSPASGATKSSEISLDVGLHAQLVNYDVRTSDGANVGRNPAQTVAPGKSKTYTWYAGHHDPDGGNYIPIELGAANLLPSDPLNHYLRGLFGGLIIEPQDATWDVVRNANGQKQYTMAEVSFDGGKGKFHEFVVFQQDNLPKTLSRGITSFGKNINAINYKAEYLRNNVQRYCDKVSCEAGTTGANSQPLDVSCMLSENAWCQKTTGGGGCEVCKDEGFPEIPIFEVPAGEAVRIRLLHPGGTNTNEVFDIAGHTFSEAPYMTPFGDACNPHTQTANLGASQFIGTQNLCGLTDWQIDPENPAKLPAGPDKRAVGASLNEWKGSRMGQGPSNHFDAVIQRAGGPFCVPGDYLIRSFSVDHFNLGMWAIMRVTAPEDPSKCQTCAGTTSDPNTCSSP